MDLDSILLLCSSDLCSFWTAVLEKTLESPLDWKEIKPVNPKGNQPWIFIRRTDAETEAARHWPSDAKGQLIRKDPNAGKDWSQEKGTTEDEMDGWHYWLNGHEFEQAPGDGEGQGSLACCSPWSRKESDMTEQLNWTKLVPTGLLRLSLLNRGWITFFKNKSCLFRKMW